jgi:uncharacterized membrane protein YvbJ
MKFCTHCGEEIADDAVICVKCGCSTGKVVPKNQGTSGIEKSTGNISDILLIVFVGIIFLIFVIQRIIISLVPEWYGSPARILYYFLSIIENLSYFLPAFSINNRMLKILGIIGVAIPSIYGIVSLVKIMML